MIVQLPQMKKKCIAHCFKKEFLEIVGMSQKTERKKQGKNNVNSRCFQRQINEQSNTLNKEKEEAKELIYALSTNVLLAQNSRVNKTVNKEGEELAFKNNRE